MNGLREIIESYLQDAWGWWKDDDGSWGQDDMYPDGGHDLDFAIAKTIEHEDANP